MNDQVAETAAETTNEAASYGDMADRIAENMAIAALRVGDAVQDLVGLMNSLVSAGKELESALSIQRELGAASLKAVEQAREAASQAQAAANEAHGAKDNAETLLQRMDDEYGTVAGLVGNLQERIAALSVLGAPLPVRNGHRSSKPETVEPEASADEARPEAEEAAESETASEDANVTEFRAVS